MEIVKTFFFEIHGSALGSVDIAIFKVQNLMILTVKVGKVELIEYTDREAFTALTYIGFHHEHKVNKYTQMLFKVYYFFARTLSLLADRLS